MRYIPIALTSAPASLLCGRFVGITEVSAHTFRIAGNLLRLHEDKCAAHSPVVNSHSSLEASAHFPISGRLNIARPLHRVEVTSSRQ